MAKIIPLRNITKLDIPVERVLEAAKDQLDGVVLLGFDKSGNFYGASSYSDAGTVLYLMEACKKMLMGVGED